MLPKGETVQRARKFLVELVSGRGETDVPDTFEQVLAAERAEIVKAGPGATPTSRTPRPTSSRPTWASRSRVAASAAPHSRSACCRPCTTSARSARSTTSRRCPAADSRARGGAPGCSARRRPRPASPSRPTCTSRPASNGSASARPISRPGQDLPDGARFAGWDPIHHLRLFANYLTPRKGLLSGDSWRAAAVVLAQPDAHLAGAAADPVRRRADRTALLRAAAVRRPGRRRIRPRQRDAPAPGRRSPSLRRCPELQERPVGSRLGGGAAAAGAVRADGVGDRSVDALQQRGLVDHSRCHAGRAAGDRRVRDRRVRSEPDGSHDVEPAAWQLHAHPPLGHPARRAHAGRRGGHRPEHRARRAARRPGDPSGQGQSRDRPGTPRSSPRSRPAPSSWPSPASPTRSSSSRSTTCSHGNFEGWKEKLTALGAVVGTVSTVYTALVSAPSGGRDKADVAKPSFVSRLVLAVSPRIALVLLAGLAAVLMHKVTFRIIVMPDRLPPLSAAAWAGLALAVFLAWWENKQLMTEGARLPVVYLIATASSCRRSASRPRCPARWTYDYPALRTVGGDRGGAGRRRGAARR